MKKTSTKKYILGNFLRELREKKGVNLKEAEQAMGVSNAYISQLETGTKKNSLIRIGSAQSRITTTFL